MPAASPKRPCTGVLEDLRWLGLDWDEGPEVGGPHGPYRQSQRLDIYRETADRLLAQGDAYPCYCTAEELDERRKAALKRGEAPGYDGRCRDLTQEEREAFEAEGRTSVVRFRMPEQEWVVEDLVKGTVRFAADQQRDFVLMRSDGSPVFLLAVAVDDLLMGVTHVVRGDDLLSSAPRNMAVIRALGGTPPAYAHLPQVLGPDRQPLSKRHGSTSVQAFREQGFLPEALVNYLALLGWSAGEDQEFLSREEMIASFDLARVSSNPAAFDTEKLTWMNNHYIQQTDDDELAAQCLHFLTEAGLMPDPVLLRAAMPIVKERMKTLVESVELLRFLFTDDIELNEKAAALVAKAPPGYLETAADTLDAVDPWDAASIAAALDSVAESAGLEPHEGMAARARRRHGFEHLAAAPGIAGAPREGTDGGARARRRRVMMKRVVLLVLVSIMTLGGLSVAPAQSSPHSARVPSVASLRPPIVWHPFGYGLQRRREMGAYSKRHYGVWSWKLIHPQVIVEHYTAGTSVTSVFNYYAANSVHLGELPGVCAHFVIDTDGTIYQEAPLGYRCRHVVGINYTAIGIEHVGTSDAQILQQPGHDAILAAAHAVARRPLQDADPQRDRSRREPDEPVPSRALSVVAMPDARRLAARGHADVPGAAASKGPRGRYLRWPATCLGQPALLNEPSPPQTRSSGGVASSVVLRTGG